ncbi:Class three stress gene repressor [uncultured Ruminococcus sp.]|uniref:CtsR family transcriptional regulator n=2 Tax=Massiliimalia timonensis TaxID=1987501 RepID=A0A8J6TRD6_9FIRM|nr:CtsR family transcriptional regulator [Massiliimalia timonensis]MBS7176428.1 CtsR family transcriptional regulator [Clostridiales bacterium]SCH91823.1 Class three stress gene repressor [uncultured Clostridium sp.]SCI24573.1 Class three stress gene repressor [uncultured Ruminococcus sp.]
MNMTDLIAAQINEMLRQSGGTVKIQRNELAGKIGCVPSQINYVITNRYTLENGYLVESRRGGGGFIQIVKLDYDNKETIFHLINSIGSEIDETSARVILENLTSDKILTTGQYKLILAAMSDQNFKGLSDPAKRTIRANLMKMMLLTCAK